jgi:catechol 2,3-dioxygenase-like lactoylglutathione lyase family enzyme
MAVRVATRNDVAVGYFGHAASGRVCEAYERHVSEESVTTTVNRTKETRMLGNKDAVANVAVKDLGVATDFYRNTLGLKPVHQEGKELVVFQSGDSSINVYRSEYAGTNKATAVTWTVDSVEDEVKALRNKGVTFEHYDMPGMKREGDVHVDGHMKVAWFKDPDGNILNVVSK